MSAVDTMSSSIPDVDNLIGDDRLDGADVCPACLAELSDGKSFCPVCNAPVSPTAAISPFERVFAEGYIYRQAVSAPRKLIVIVGVWCIFLSLLGSGIAMVAYEYLYGPWRLASSWLLDRSASTMPRGTTLPDLLTKQSPRLMLRSCAEAPSRLLPRPYVQRAAA